MTKKYDYLVVGAGLFGAVFAQQCSENGYDVLVIERRNHIGGNCYSFEYEDTGINIHKYGTHIFHTDDSKVWSYICRFTAFNTYQHRVLTNYKGRIYSMPINLATINSFYGINLRPFEVDAFLESKKEKIDVPANLEEKAVSLIGRDLYEAFIKGYTIKQWGCSPLDLPASIIDRLPVRISYRDNYFDDPYQGIPLEGYTPIFKKMLKNVDVELNIDFFEDRLYFEKIARKVVYTGPIDRFFDFTYGRLGWRSVKLEEEVHDVQDYQGTSVMNYADEYTLYTRIHEWKHLHPERLLNKNCTMDKTVITREYSYTDADNPYYPINLVQDREQYTKYCKLAEKQKNVFFGGRLAEYRYYDMDDALRSALKLAGKLL